MTRTLVSTVAAIDLYERGLTVAPLPAALRGRSCLRLVSDDGAELGLPIERWMGELTEEEDSLLRRACAPVLDIGCGPGRHAVALRSRGVCCLGIDIAPAAVAIARGRGADVLHGCIFGHVPRAGSWGSALLLDGNLGIGGDPAALLQRVATLLRPGGTALVETAPPATPSETLRLRFETDEASSQWFAWARVNADDLRSLAAATDFKLAERWEARGRWFARLVKAQPPASD